jgi:predicted small secreted protein
MKKKILALTLALALSLSLAACGGKDAPGQDADSGVPEVNAPEGGAPEDDAPEGGGTDAPDASAPEDGGTDSPETEASEEINLSAFYNTLREGNIWPELMDLTTDANMKELLDSYYPGLAEIAAKQRRVYIAAMSAAVGEIALVEVENAEDVQAVEDIFQARIDYQVGDDATPGGAWYPETIEGWKTKSRIVSHGNYVMLAVGDASASAVEEFEALFA